MLGLPQVCGLASEGSAVDPEQAGEVAGMVLAEVPEQLRIAVEAEELADQLDGDDLTVGQEGVGAAPAEVVEVGGVEFIVYSAEDCEDKIVEGPGGALWFKPAVTTGL